MTRHDHKNKDSKRDSEKGLYRPDEDRPRQTVRVLGMEIEPAQFWIIFFCLAPLSLLHQFGVFASAGLNTIQIVAIVAPLVLMALLLAFTRIDGRPGGSYLHMALGEKLGQRTLASRKSQRRINQPGNQPGNHREDEGV